MVPKVTDNHHCSFLKSPELLPGCSIVTETHVFAFPHAVAETLWVLSHRRQCFPSLPGASAGPVSMETPFRSREGKDLPARMSEAAGATRCGRQRPVSHGGRKRLRPDPDERAPAGRCDAGTRTRVGWGRPRDPRPGWGGVPGGRPQAGHRENAQGQVDKGKPLAAARRPEGQPHPAGGWSPPEGGRHRSPWAHSAFFVNERH